MNPIANCKIKEVINYLCVDIEDPVDTPVSRAEQQKGLEVFRKTMLMLSADDMADNEYCEIYKNSFSRCRSRFDEYSRVLLTSKLRT